MAMYKQLMSRIYPGLVAILTSQIVSSSIIYLMLVSKPTIATVDVMAITTQFIQEEANKNHSKQEKEIAIKAFSHQLEAALQTLSQSKNLILLPKEAVIKGGKDYTVALHHMMTAGRPS